MVKSLSNLNYFELTRVRPNFSAQVYAQISSFQPQ